ncbi:hypothetical protein HMPREF9303_1162 [Prevotella denticola CRIS 18C-A]|uniref:Uncharacterized protein n=1 Tax=Prevotella denticola CRIS 18C-A TaxID=944557 RepID=F0H7C4_9BACT|nr:hypothetical protein HMPREF9303_1162 [Prevotella denticola CRIS 18C-A]
MVAWLYAVYRNLPCTVQLCGRIQAVSVRMEAAADCRLNEERLDRPRIAVSLHRLSLQVSDVFLLFPPSCFEVCARLPALR